MDSPCLRLIYNEEDVVIGEYGECRDGPLELEVLLAAVGVDFKSKFLLVFQEMGDPESVGDPIWPITTN
jgi:hypothetical protein